MAERLREHPLLSYVIFALPALLLLLALLAGANVFILIVLTAWLGVTFIVLFLPVVSDNGQSQ